MEETALLYGVIGRHLHLVFAYTLVLILSSNTLSAEFWSLTHFWSWQKLMFLHFQILSVYLLGLQWWTRVPHSTASPMVSESLYVQLTENHTVCLRIAWRLPRSSATSSLHAAFTLLEWLQRSWCNQVIEDERIIKYFHWFHSRPH